MVRTKMLKVEVVQEDQQAPLAQLEQPELLEAQRQEAKWAHLRLLLAVEQNAHLHLVKAATKQFLRIKKSDVCLTFLFAYLNWQCVFCFKNPTYSVFNC